jgi:hypothetical protein
MYVGTSSPPRSGSRLYNSRRLVNVEQRRAEQKHRRQHQQREERSPSNRLVTKAVQDNHEHQSTQEDHDHERRQRAELVYEVRAGELRAAAESVAKRASLNEHRGNGETDERKVRKRDEIEARQDHDPLDNPGQDRDKRCGERDGDAPALGVKRELARTDIRERARRCAECRHEHPHKGVRQLDSPDARQRRTDPERQRGPEASAVEAQ